MDDLLGVTCDTRRLAIEQANELDALRQELARKGRDVARLQRQLEEKSKEKEGITASDPVTPPCDIKYACYERDKAMGEAKIAAVGWEKAKGDVLVLEEKADELQREKDGLEDALASLEVRVATQEELGQKCKKTHEEYRKTQKNTHKTYLAAAGAHDALRGEMKKLLETSTALYEKLQNASAEKKTTTDQATAAQEAYLKEANKTSELTSLVHAAQEEIKSSKMTITALTNDVESLRNINEELSGVISALQSELGSVKAALGEEPVWVVREVDAAVRLADVKPHSTPPQPQSYTFIDVSGETGALSELLTAERKTNQTLKNYIAKLQDEVLTRLTAMTPPKPSLSRSAQLCEELLAENAALKLPAATTASQHDTMTPGARQKRRRITGILHKQG